MKLRPSAIHHSQNLLWQHFGDDIYLNSNEDALLLTNPIQAAVSAAPTTSNSNHPQLLPLVDQKACGSENATTSNPKIVLPKLQVFKKGNCYFALNNNCLNFYRSMELNYCQKRNCQKLCSGVTTDEHWKRANGNENDDVITLNCSSVMQQIRQQQQQEQKEHFTVEVQIVPLNKIPKPIIDMSICSVIMDNDEGDSSHTSSGSEFEDDDDDYETIATVAAYEGGQDDENDDSDDEEVDDRDNDESGYAESIAGGVSCAKCETVFDNVKDMVKHQVATKHLSCCKNCKKVFPTYGRFKGQDVSSNEHAFSLADHEDEFD